MRGRSNSPNIARKVDENEDFLDNEAEDDEYNDDANDQSADADDEEQNLSDNDDDNNTDHEEDDNEPKDALGKSKSRIISAFDDSDDELENATKAIDDILNKSIVVENEHENKLWINEDEKNADDENELLGLCSGRFEITQKTGPTQMTQGESNLDDLSLSLGRNENLNDSKNLESPSKGDILELESSDDEGIKLKSKKSPRKLKKKQRKKLGFSDDEENEDEVPDNNENDSNKQSEDEEDVVETYIDYDSEENEIEVQMNKKDRLQKASAFFEKEAELSESEWGSEDEDEKDLDKYDIELGDEDHFDRNKIRKELEKIHHREMLDEDMRDVRMVKEMFLEDEDDVGAKRQRQFKWKHSTNGFILDDPNGENQEGLTPAEGELVDENEELWRKMRHERELLLKESGNTTEPLVDYSTPNISMVKTTKKIVIIKKTKPQSTTDGANGNVDSPFLISKVDTTSVRGSFLVRDKETLSKLASITKASADSDGAAGVVAGKGRNFVFATLSEEQLALKRKSPDTSRDDENSNQIKKQKLSSDIGKKQRLIDLL